MTSPAIRRAVHGPITALAFFPRGEKGGDDEGERYVLVGEDTQLKVYEVQSGRLCLEVQVFRGQAIHGIRVSAENLLIWGARSVAVASVRGIEGALAGPSYAGGGVCFEAGEARDWIYDGVLDPGGRRSGVLVTSHNEVVEMSWSEGRGLSFGDILAPSRSMLYAASVRLLADGRVLVAGGTVFGEILVWTCRRVGEGKGRCRVLHVLTGHDGSIFGVDISDEIELGGRTLRLMASCSDDRTVRVWDISDTASEGGEEVEGSDGNLLHEARETGFGHNATGDSGEGTALEEPIAMAMGHMSRIWSVRFPPLPPGRPASSTIPIYSFGEDATALAWDLDLRNFQGRDATGSGAAGASPAIPATLSHRATFSNHDGKHLWSSAMSSRGDGTLLIATGGADGKVSLIEEAEPLLDVGRSDTCDGAPSSTMIDHETLALLDSPGEEGKKARNRNDYLRRYVFIGEDTILSATRSGKLLIGSFGRGITWSEVSIDAEYHDDLKMCSVMSSPAADVAIIGTTTKMLYLYADGRLSRLGSVPGKVLNLIPLSSEGDSTAILLTMHNSPDVRILTASLGAREISSDISLRAVDERFVLTSAALFYGYLIIGSRNGFMEVFAAQEGAYTRIAEIRPRSDDAITSIVPLPGQTGLCPISFLTTNRDGMYRIYELDTTDGQPIRTRLLHETPPPFGPQIEDAWFCEDEGGGPASLILSGFRSKDFIAWNETRREYVAVVDCGGAHRTFAHSKSARPGRIHLAFTKAAKVYIHSQARPTIRTLKPGSHGREVRAVASGAGYFATGSEDTTIRIWERRADDAEEEGGQQPRGAPFRCVASTNAHTTGIQCLRWCGDRLLSSGGNEDLFVWRVSRLVPGGVAVSCEGVFGDKSPLGDLRITDLDVCAEDDDRGGEGEGALRVTMAFSNSVFKTYRYEPPGAAAGGKGRFEVLARGEYTGACITQVRNLGRREGAVLPDVLTAATDGYIALWTPVGASYVTTSVARIHQSSIKSLDLRAVAEPQGDGDGDGEGVGYVVTTGGDDNALAVTSLTPDSEGTLTVSGRTIVRSAHAAAINGVVGLPGGSRVVTVSNDQRVKVWEVSGGTSGGGPPRARLVEDAYSGVSDAAAVEYLGCTGEVVVGGAGTEIWRCR